MIKEEFAGADWLRAVPFTPSSDVRRSRTAVGRALACFNGKQLEPNSLFRSGWAVALLGIPATSDHIELSCVPDW